MTLEYLALPADLPVSDALIEFRRLAREMRGFYYLYAVDAAGRLLGVVNLRELLIAEVDKRLGDIAAPDPLFVHALDDQESAAQLIARYDLLALPVVDEDHRLIGVIQHEDLVDVIVEEATEDMYKLVGVGTQERTQTPIKSSLRRRFPWLVLNLCTQLLLVGVLLYFQDAIASVAALAVLFPIVTGQGGNVGAQTMTLMVRSLALGEVDRSNASRLVAKELVTGCLLGLAMGGLAGGLALLVGGGTTLATQLCVAVWAAMALNLAVGALAGALVPLGLDRVGIDPAVASSMMVTSVTDTLGVILFMGIFLAIL
jgi:magnesium transporter